MNRREFLETVAAAAACRRCVAGHGHARQRVGDARSSTCTSTSARSREQPRAPGRAGVTKANLLTRGDALEQVKALEAAAPGRFTWFHSYDVSKPDAEQVLTQAVKDGAQGFGEMKFHVAADGPELRRIYALAADLHVPILVHFQEVDHFPNEGTWSTGYARPSRRF
jgi:predicted TIM-barrel fold metal-dependent hydrolase